MKPSCKSKLGFDIISPQKSYSFVVKTKEELTQWTERIEGAIYAAIGGYIDPVQVKTEIEGPGIVPCFEYHRLDLTDVQCLN